MKMSELLNLVLRSSKDTSPRMSLYADALREHMVKTHKDLLDEDVKIE